MAAGRLVCRFGPPRWNRNGNRTGGMAMRPYFIEDLYAMLAWQGNSSPSRGCVRERVRATMC
jgi:hypothetical protein